MAPLFSRFFRKLVTLCLPVAIVPLLPAAPALGDEAPLADAIHVYVEEARPGIAVSGRASTEIQWRDESRLAASLPLYQYLLFNVRRFDEKLEEKYSFHAYGRLGTDLNNEDSLVDSRLYYAYFQQTGLLEKIDLRLGRQFIAITAGASLLDGLTLDYHLDGPLTFRVFGGGDVAFYSGYNAKDTIMGGEVRGRFREDALLAGLSYVQRREDSRLATELIGADFDYGSRKPINLYGEIQYDRLSDRVSYGLLGGNYHHGDRWGLRAEYLYSLPVFSANSIYSVFAVSKYQELMGEVSFYLGSGYRGFGRYSREVYEDYRDADVFEAGLEKIRSSGRFSGYLSGVWRAAGEGQDLRGARVRAAWLLTNHLQAGIGAEIDVLERRLDEFEDDTLSTRYWADITARLRKDLELQARIERAESSGFWGYHNRGTLRLNVTF